MKSPPTAETGSKMPSDPTLAAHIGQNIETVVALQRRERQSLSAAQRRVETVSQFISRPGYLVTFLTFVAVWIGGNSASEYITHQAWDPFPYNLLDTAMSLIALVTTTIVLIAQNRQTRREQQHNHLALQVNLLTEQKVTKLIHLIEELRGDLPMVKDRHDPQSAAMQERADATEVLNAIEEGGLARTAGARSTSST